MTIRRTYQTELPTTLTRTRKVPLYAGRTWDGNHLYVNTMPKIVSCYPPSRTGGKAQPPQTRSLIAHVESWQVTHKSMPYGSLTDFLAENHYRSFKQDVEFILAKLGLVKPKSFHFTARLQIKIGWANLENHYDFENINALTAEYIVP
jgi:hypothetical protein